MSEENVSAEVTEETAVTPAPDGGSPPSPEPSDSTEAQEPGVASPPEGDGGTLSEEEEALAPSDWPVNWRDIASGGDPRVQKYLSRYASPLNVVRALMAFRNKMDTGEMVRSKPDPEDKEAMNEWRAQMSIPDEPAGYLEKMPNGVVFGEEDQERLDSFLNIMHESDAPPEYVHKALQWYYSMSENSAARIYEEDQAYHQQSEDELHARYGPEFRPNITGAANMINLYGEEGLGEKIFTARAQDGRLLGDDPAIVDLFVSLNKEINPHGTITPSAGQTPLQTINTELEAIRAEMSDTKSDYYHNESKQARYRELLDMEAKLKGRAA